MDNRMEKLLLTIDEAAELVGLGRSKLYELVRTGQIDSVKIGRARRVHIAAVRAFVDRLQSESHIPTG